MDVFEKLRERGLLQDISDAEGIKTLKPGDSFYVGFDPTGPSLHFGHLLQLIVMVHLSKKAGLKPIALFGGATGAIGDPKETGERALLPREVISANIETQKAKVIEILERQGCQAKFVDNLEWTAKIGALEFLRDIGKHFTVNYMLAKEVVKTRLRGEGLSFTEFSYMLLQAQDFLFLLRNYNCKLQFGGSDQWGNITAGLELIRRKGLSQAYAFSVPLLVDEQGRKYGKSENGALWLNSDMTSAYKFHQFWLNVSDSDVIKLLKLFTFLDNEQIGELQEELKQHPEKRTAQKTLADAVCTFVHGAEKTGEAKKCAAVLFGGSLRGLTESQLLEIFADVPSSTLSRHQLAKLTMLDLLTQSGLVKSKSEARRLIAAKGAYLNNETITEEKLTLTSSELDKTKLLVLRSGKKNYHLVKLI